MISAFTATHQFTVLFYLLWDAQLSLFYCSVRSSSTSLPLLPVDWHFCHLAAIEVIFGGSGGGGDGFADDDLLIDDGGGGGVVYFLWSSFLHLLGDVSPV